MTDYIYYDHLNLDIPLSDSVKIVKSTEGQNALISNHANIQSQLIAPEIDFYLQNTQDDFISKAKGVDTLFEARATCFDYSQDSDYEQEVGKNVLLVGQNLTSLQQKLKDRGFSAITINPNEVSLIKGHLGALEVTIYHNEELIEVEFDQIVWPNAPEFALIQSGVIELINEDEIIEALESKTGTHKYKNFTSYDPSICQYHERRAEICSKCAEVCPTVAIVKLDETKHLKFSHIDCHGCGGCVSVCPSGAIDYAQMPQFALYEIARLYEDTTPLIIPRKMSLENLHVELPSGVLPFAIEGEKYLHEAHLLTLLQESGSQLIFYTDFLSKGTKDSIYMINQIYQNIFGVNGVIVAMDENELKEALKIAKSIPNSKRSIQDHGLRKREVFSQRLFAMVGEDDFGMVKSGEHVHYGNVTINESACTLCLSCIGACNIGALAANAEDNTIRFNPSICTTCTYCEVTCPEKNCLSVQRGEISLNKSWFSSRVMATDTLFECVMCRTPFATTKSVEKIASMMLPLFAGDEIKIKSLYCCSECKPKLMFQAHLDSKEFKI